MNKIKIIRITNDNQKAKKVLRNLVKMYCCEWSQYNLIDVNSKGEYPFEKDVASFFKENGKFAFLMSNNDIWIGFVLVDQDFIIHQDYDYSLAEFFILPPYRQRGFGKELVNYVFNRLKGNWEIGRNPKNLASVKFWDRVIDEYTNGNYEIVKSTPLHKYQDGTFGDVMSFQMDHVLKTKRLILRKFRETDVNELYRILGDKETMAYYPAPYDLNGTKRWINWNLNNYKNKGFGLWAIDLILESSCDNEQNSNSSTQFIGDCGVTMQNINGNVVPEVGFHIHKAYWNKGYATEAARAVIKYIFKCTDIETLYCYQHSDNIASRRVAEHIGMHLKELYIDTDQVEVSVYVINKGEQND